MATNVDLQPVTLIDYIKSGSRYTFVMAGKHVSLYDLPEAMSNTSNLTRAYFFDLNQQQIQLYLCGPLVSFESMVAAMNSSIPSAHSEAALVYLSPADGCTYASEHPS